MLLFCSLLTFVKRATSLTLQKLISKISFDAFSSIGRSSEALFEAHTRKEVCARKVTKRERERRKKSTQGIFEIAS